MDYNQAAVMVKGLKNVGQANMAGIWNTSPTSFSSITLTCVDLEHSSRYQCDLLHEGPHKKTCLGKVVADFKVIELQKRGLPHAHILLILGETCKPDGPRGYDTIVSAEISDRDTHPAAYGTVTRMMMHGPCGENFPNAPCMIGGRCSKRYPKDFAEETTNLQASPTMAGSTYNAHINVEVCTGVGAVKYLYKYVFNGHDKALVSMRQRFNQTQQQHPPQQREPVNEIQLYRNARYVSASEAIWHLFSFSLFYRSPAVQLLVLHLPNQQSVYYRETDNLEAIVHRTSQHPTTLMAFFDLNRNSVSDMDDSDSRNTIHTQQKDPIMYSEHETWRERTPAVKDLEENIMQRGEMSAKERKLFSKRKKIINAIHKIRHEEHVTIAKAENRLEQRHGIGIGSIVEGITKQSGHTTE